MSEERLWNKYLDWILEKYLKIHQPKYRLLMEILHNTPFVYVIDRDINRADDGLYLRNDFYEYMNLDENFMFGREACVLEVLAALAYRMETEYVGDPEDPKVGKIFCEFVKNLGLNRFTNDRMDADLVAKIVKKWMMRDIKFHGECGIFPLKITNRDQRSLELWSQMQEYITENYHET